MKRIVIFLILFLSVNSLVYSEIIEVPKNQAKLEINGAVCAYCAYGVQKSLSKMDSVDKSKGHKGVEADVDNQIIIVYLKDGYSLDLKKSYKAIRKGGYEPRTFHLRVQGDLINENNKIYLMNSSNEKLFELIGEKMNKLQNKKFYDLQLIMNKPELSGLRENIIPQAKIYSIIKGE